MKKIFLVLFIQIICICFFLCMPGFAAEKKVGFVNITYETNDNFVIKSKLFYPAKDAAVHPAVVMLHSLGYSGDYWEPLTKSFVDSGVAVLVIDLRGHGASSYDSNFRIKSWRYFTYKTFAKYPEDVSDILKYVASFYKNVSTTKYVILGADIGANTAILTADKMVNKPKGLVLMSPSRNFKGLCTPLAIANIGDVPILSIASVSDKYFYSESLFLKRFAQGTYDLKTYPSGGTGMLMLKANPGMSKDILDWVLPKLK